MISFEVAVTLSFDLELVSHFMNSAINKYKSAELQPAIGSFLNDIYIILNREDEEGRVISQTLQSLWQELAANSLTFSSFLADYNNLLDTPYE